MILEPKQQVTASNASEALLMLFMAGVVLCFICPPLGFFLLFVCLLAIVMVIYTFIIGILKSLLCKLTCGHLAVIILGALVIGFLFSS